MPMAPPAFDPDFDGPACVALSGGVDSIALLHALAASPDARNRGLRALHVHHGLHADADDWTRLCAEACARLDVPLDVARVTVDTTRGDGPEAAARAARYAAFAAYLAPGEALALAHHLDDQAETFLLRALRGSGVDGLGAMRPLRRFAPGWLWRPWLRAPRAAIAAYARAHRLAFATDPGNGDDRFDRNFLRLHVLPLLRTRWPHAAAAFARSAGLASDASAMLGASTADTLARMLEAPLPLEVRAGTPSASTADADRAAAAASPAPPLPLDALSGLDASERARVLRHWVSAAGAPPLPAGGVARIEADLLDARRDGNAEFRWGPTRIRAWGGALHLLPPLPPLPRDWSATWTGEEPLTLPDGSGIELEPAMRWPVPVHVRLRRGGERIRLPRRDRSHALKHVLQDLRVPPWVRGRWPLLFDEDGELLAAGDAVRSARLDDWLQAHGRRLRWHPASPIAD